jgi:hypothetical protein
VLCREEARKEMRALCTPAILLVSFVTAQGEPLPQPKIGQCPGGYRESGYCTPMNDKDPAAIPKTG